MNVTFLQTSAFDNVLFLYNIPVTCLISRKSLLKQVETSSYYLASFSSNSQILFPFSLAEDDFEIHDLVLSFVFNPPPHWDPSLTAVANQPEHLKTLAWHILIKKSSFLDSAQGTDIKDKNLTNFLTSFMF